MFLSGSMWEDRGQPSASLLEEHSTIVIKLIKVCVCVCGNRLGLLRGENVKDDGGCLSCKWLNNGCAQSRFVSEANLSSAFWEMYGCNNVQQGNTTSVSTHTHTLSVTLTH